MNATLLLIIKFVLSVLLAPFAWAACSRFYMYVQAFPGAYEDFFLSGVFGFILIYLFFYQFWGVFEFGQRLVSGLVQFTAPANQFIAKIIPFYVTTLVLIFYAVKHWLGADQYDHYFMFFGGFALTMHVVLIGQDMQENEKVFIKPDYLFTMICAVILLMGVSVLLFNLALKEFTLPGFAEAVWEDAMGVYSVVLGKMI